MRYRWLMLLGLAFVLIGGAIYVATRPAPASLSSISSATGPWPAETTHLKERLAAIGLPALSAEGNALHIHQHLDLVIHGKPATIPADIGVHTAFPAFISPIHTHDETGIVHVESPTVGKFYLGEFFDIWGVRLTSACIGGYCADEKNSLTFYVNGERYQGDPRRIELTPHEELTIVYGAASEMPTSTPKSYAFPEGY